MILVSVGEYLKCAESESLYGGFVMHDFIGVVRLEKSIPCLKEVSGKIFKSKIGGA